MAGVQEAHLRKSESTAGRGPLGSLQVLIRTATLLEASCSSATRLRPHAKVRPPLQVYRHQRVAHGGPQARERGHQLAEVLHDVHAGSPRGQLGGPPSSSTAALAAAAAACAGRLLDVVGCRSIAAALCVAAADLCRREAQLQGVSSTGMLHHCGLCP